MLKLAIIHFHPVELYPPVMNLINYIAQENHVDIKVRVYSMKDDETLNNFTSSSPCIRILRKGVLYRNRNRWKRYIQFINYGMFYTAVSAELLAWQPSVILYFETLSSLPAIIYEKLTNKKPAIMIHYHEYSSLQEYETGMTLNKWFHALEKKVYYKAAWVSHTNEVRMQKFLTDHSTISIPNTYILPNYPPAAWKNKVKTNYCSEGVKIIYVGAFSLDTMYTREFAQWVLKQRGKFVWHIYSGNITPEAKSYILSLQTDYIVFKGYINYYQLPEVLSSYDVGVVLYRGLSENYIYNAPNKLFEYFACGLDVWFPLVMQGSIPYITDNTYPKISGLDFNSLDEEDITDLTDRSKSMYKPSEYYCEYVLCKLVDKILNSKTGILSDSIT